MANRTSVSVADEVWIATALLHQEYPEKNDFKKSEILERIGREGLVKPQRPGVSAHISSHAVATKRPQPNDYRLLVETERGRRRLFREGDIAHHARKGKTAPSPEEIPSSYLPLLRWYEAWKKKRAPQSSANDPLLALIGRGKEIWADEHADDYVRRLRENW